MLLIEAGKGPTSGASRHQYLQSISKKQHRIPHTKIIWGEKTRNTILVRLSSPSLYFSVTQERSLSNHHSPLPLSSPCSSPVMDGLCHIPCSPEPFISTTFFSLFLHDHFWYNIVITNRITSGYYYSKQYLSVINCGLVLQVLPRVRVIAGLLKGRAHLTQRAPDQQACKIKMQIIHLGDLSTEL